MCPSHVGDRWTEGGIQSVFWSDLQSLRQKYIFHPLQSLELNSHPFPSLPITSNQILALNTSFPNCTKKGSLLTHMKRQTCMRITPPGCAEALT